eukprot:gene13961-biopygen10853
MSAMGAGGRRRRTRGARHGPVPRVGPALPGSWVCRGWGRCPVWEVALRGGTPRLGAEPCCRGSSGPRRAPRSWRRWDCIELSPLPVLSTPRYDEPR